LRGKLPMEAEIDMADTENSAKRDEPAKKRYVSSVDVAKHAGVSQAAVSRTFTEGASVSKKTREKVEAAAQELGYRPSMIPRIMLTNKSSLIAVVSSALTHPFYAAIVDRFTKEIQKRGNTVLFFSVSDREYMDEIIPKIRGYQVDGIFSASSIASPDVAESCARMHFPVVLLNSRLRNNWVHSVNSDNVGGGRDVASLFIRKGAKRFAYLSGRKGTMASEDRLAGFFGQLAEHGITDLVVENGDFTFEGGCAAARRMFQRSNPPDAIFCANDLMAIGVLETAKSEFGIRVPDDLLVAGFDDIPVSSLPSISLTTNRPDVDRMVDEAIKLFETKLSGNPEHGGTLRVVPTRLEERGTTARPDLEVGLEHFTG
jgi:DNA-binding LacI/PurR family transcriptional regulator